MLSYQGRQVKSSCEIASKRIQGLLEAYFKNNKNRGKQEKESIIRVRVGQKNPSLAIIVCRHWQSLMIPNSDPPDGLFYPTLTLMIDYNIPQ